MLVSASSYRLLSQDPGVYLFLGEKNRILYVGKAKNLRNRVSSYFTTKNLGEKTENLILQTKKIRTVEVYSEIESLLLEANLIKKYKPKYNLKLTDDKAYPLIRITIKDKYPKVLTARKIDNNNDFYFGPFPNTSALRLVLKMTRRIFPYVSVNNHPKKVCFYNHINLCPCPEVLNDKNYKKNIKHLIKFLKGKTKAVIYDLEKERDGKSNNEQYEEAEKIQKQINAINYITSSIIKPFEYELNPNLKADLRNEEIKTLIRALSLFDIKLKKLERIECFDISNFSGKNSVGSMVVFENGESKRSLYRRFKIKNIIDKSNDYEAMNEIIKRRFKHKEWNYPDLIIVDGGKPQVSAATLALSKYNIYIPIIGLAKKDEKIITENFSTIKLNKSAKAIHLIMRIRDEAHRFAITYHKKLRSKDSFS